MTVNDLFTVNGIPGAGRILNDQNFAILPLLNEALSQLGRDLESAGAFSPKKKEAIVPNIPVLNGANGPGNTDPAAQQYLGFTGFFDGSQLWPLITLPADLLAPIALWNRGTGTGLPFNEVPENATGLPSRLQDASSVGEWEWRGDAIYLIGCLVNMDLRLRYTGSIAYFPLTLEPSDFPNTMIPILDSAQALANRMAYVFCRSRLPPGAAQELMQEYIQQKNGIASRTIKAKQGANIERQGFGSEGGVGWW